MSTDTKPAVAAPEEAAATVEDKSLKLRDTHVGLYLIMRFIGMYFTITMIATFFAESFLNTLRTNVNLFQNGHAWLRGNHLYEAIRDVYPNGNTTVTLIGPDLVAVYIFVVVVYAVFRFTYYRAIRGERTDAVIGNLTWKTLGHQPIGVRLCWLLSFRHGVHKKFFLMWMIYIFLLGITTAVGGFIGVSIYISPMLKIALYGAGAAFCFGLLEDLKVFQKIPPKEAIFSTLLALIEGIKHADLSGTIKRIQRIASETDRTTSDEVLKIFESVVQVLKAKQEQEVKKV